MPHLEDPLLQAYIDGYCNDARTAEIDTHLAGCAECRQRLDEARRAAARASELLGMLEPGPVHAPSFEELEGRAAALGGGEVPDEVAAKVADAAAPKTRAGSRPLWNRPAWAWAASLAIAFALGWLSRTEIPLPPVASAPLASVPPQSFDDAAPASKRLQANEPAPAPTLSRANEPVSREQFEVVDELDDVEAVAQLPDAGAPSTSAELPADLQPRSVPELAEDPAAAGELRAVGEALTVEQAVTTTGPPVAQGPPEPESLPVGERIDVVSEPSPARNEEVAQFGTFANVAHAGVAGGYVAIDVVAVETWLGAPPRQLPGLTLLRAEVGPGALVEDGIPQRPAVRLVYLSSNQQEISLVQQYLGPAEADLLTGDDSKEVAAPGDRFKTADGRARAQSPQAAQSRIDRQLAVGRDAVVGGLVSDAPLIVEPDGLVAYRWIDADGYVLRLSGNVDPDVIRGLAGQVR